jgi:hypothetical protein
MRKLHGSAHNRLHTDFTFVALLCVTLALILSMVSMSPAH